MRANTITLACVLLLSLNAVGQTTPQELVNAWLGASCGNNDLSPLASQLQANGDAVLPLLIAAATQGPDAEYVTQVSTAAGASYDLLQSQLATGPIRGLTNTQSNWLSAITKDEIVSDQVNAAVLAYESRAVGGLAVVGGDQAIKILQQFANDPSSPLQSAAQAALASIGIVLDTTPPAINITTPSSGAIYTANQTLNAAYACTDFGSGVATCAAPVPNGTKIDTSPNGTSTVKTFTVNAIDAVGNASSLKTTYTVSCHYISFGVSPSTVSKGSTIKVTGTVVSCTPSSQTISEKFTLTGPLGRNCAKTSAVMFATPSFSIPGDTLRNISFPFFIPKSACSGTYTTSSTTLLGGTPIDTTSTTLTVQ